MTDIHEEAAERFVELIMNSLGTNLCQKQALLQAYFQIDLPDYPTTLSANLTNAAGQFVIAGERVKVSQRQAVWHARKTLSKILAEQQEGENLFAALRSDAATSTTSQYQFFLRALYADSGTYLDDVSS
jgi:hypothetical protein